MPKRQLLILHLLLSMGETSAPYNEHCLPAIAQQNMTICTFFKPTVTPAKGITLYSGDNTLRGFFRVLRVALTEQEYDIIHAHSVHVATFLLLVNLFLRLKSKSKTVYTLHSSYPNYKLTNKLMLILTVAFFRRIVCCSYASFDSLPGFLRYLAGDRLCVVQNGIDIERIDRAIKSHSGCNRTDYFTITAVGRLIEVKNPFSIQMAFQQSDDMTSRLVFIGEGNLRDALIAEGTRYGLGERVKFAGLISREEVYEYLTKTDVFISTSKIEGLPVAVLEAMACYCPVILSDIAPHREITAGVDFIALIPINDVDGFAREIKRLREMPALERIEIGKKCRKLVEERFSLAVMQERYKAVYAQLLSQQ